MELEIENDRLRVLAEEGKSSKLGWGAIVGIIVMMIFVMGGGYALGRYVFHMSIVWSIIAAPALFILLILLVVVADWIGLLE